MSLQDPASAWLRLKRSALRTPPSTSPGPSANDYASPTYLIRSAKEGPWFLAERPALSVSSCWSRVVDRCGDRGYPAGYKASHSWVKGESDDRLCASVLIWHLGIQVIELKGEPRTVYRGKAPEANRIWTHLGRTELLVIGAMASRVSETVIVVSGVRGLGRKAPR